VKWLMIGLAIVIVAAAIGAAAALIGTRLPQSHRASVERVLPVPPEILWRTLTDIDAFPVWRKDLKRVQRLVDRDGKPAWVEEGSNGRMTFVFEHMDAPRVLVSRIADPGLPFGGTWTSEVTPVAEGSRLKITEEGEIYNPLFRFTAHYVFGYDGTLKGYAAALETRFHGI